MAQNISLSLPESPHTPMLAHGTASALGCVDGRCKGLERAVPAGIPVTTAVFMAALAVITTPTRSGVHHGLVLSGPVLANPERHGGTSQRKNSSNAVLTGGDVYVPLE
jgi:hypothetical protein